MTIDIGKGEFESLEEQLRTNQSFWFYAFLRCLLLILTNGYLLILIRIVYIKESYYVIPIIIVCSVLAGGIYLLICQLKYCKKLYLEDNILGRKYSDEVKSNKQLPRLDEDSLYFYRD